MFLHKQTLYLFHLHKLLFLLKVFQLKCNQLERFFQILCLLLLLGLLLLPFQNNLCFATQFSKLLGKLHLMIAIEHILMYHFQRLMEQKFVFRFLVMSTNQSRHNQFFLLVEVLLIVKFQGYLL